MKKICPECKTENEEQFRFCKNCGTALAFEKEELNENFNTPEQFDPAKNSGAQMPDGVEGAKKAEIMAFVGKNADNFYKKFLKSEFSGSKISWCWPVFLLNFFFGFLGSAIWFFYRKMYKASVVLIAIGVLFLGINTALTFDASVEAYKMAGSAIENIVGSSDANSAVDALEQFVDAAEVEPAGVLALIADGLHTLENVIGSIIVSMFAVSIYKKYVILKIAQQREKHGDTQYYLYTLSMCGGTSGGMLAVGIVCYIVLTNVASSVPMLFAMGGF